MLFKITIVSESDQRTDSPSRVAVALLLPIIVLAPYRNSTCLALKAAKWYANKPTSFDPWPLRAMDSRLSGGILVFGCL